MAERIDTLVVGAGQAGIAASAHLGRRDIPHLVVERDRIAERWRTARWDSLVANGPAWHDRFPEMGFDGLDDDAFPSKDRVAAYFEAFAARIDAPVRTGIEVRRAVRAADGTFRVETSEGIIRARRIIAATGPFQRPVHPDFVPAAAGVTQIHSAAYRHPAALPAGNVLVVGAGSSGVQIADELNQAGRRVTLSVGPHDRPPRRYRGRDYCWWLGVLGLWDIQTPPAGAEHVTIAVSGAAGGATVDFRRLAAGGITLAGRATGYRDGAITFDDGLAASIAHGDANYLSVLDAADAHVARMGLDLPEEPAARDFLPDPPEMTKPIRRLELGAAGITSIIWATGYRQDWSWLAVDTIDAKGKPRHQRGVGAAPGIYFLGLPWLSRRGSSFIWGVWHDAGHIADQIAIQRAYEAYGGKARIVADQS